MSGCRCERCATLQRQAAVGAPPVSFKYSRTCATSCRRCKHYVTVGPHVQRAREVVQASFRAVVDGAAAPLDACLALACDAEPVPPSLSSSARLQAASAL